VLLIASELMLKVTNNSLMVETAVENIIVVVDSA